jgi:hypothetical protein
VARIQDKAQADVRRIQDKAEAERNKLEVARVEDKYLMRIVAPPRTTSL